MIRSDLGKIGAALQAGRNAAANIDFGPIKSLEVINNQNNKPIADWHNEAPVTGQFIMGVSAWGSLTDRMSK